MPRKSYPGNIRSRRPGKWELAVSVAGERHYKTVNATNITEAKGLMKTWYDELVEAAEKRTTGVDVDRTVLEHIAQFREYGIPFRDASSTRKELEGLCDRVEYWIKNVEKRNPKLTKAGKAYWNRFIEWRHNHKWGWVGEEGEKRREVVEARVSDRTLQKDRTMLHTMVQRAVDEEILEGNTIAKAKKVRAAERKPRILSDSQLERLIAAMRGDMRQLFVEAMASTAARSESEVLWIRWEDIDWDHGYIWIWDDPEEGHRTKTREGRWVAVTREFMDRLRDHAAKYRMKAYHGKRSPWLFHHTADRRHANAGQRVGSFYRAFVAAAKRAGLPGDLHQHDLRHMAITRLLAEGKPVEKVQKQAGHADIRTTMKYTHLVREDLRVLVEDTGTQLDPAHLQTLLESSDAAVREAAIALVGTLRKRG